MTVVVVVAVAEAVVAVVAVYVLILDFYFERNSMGTWMCLSIGYCCTFFGDKFWLVYHLTHCLA
jgi:hypothetical protein